MVPGLRLAACIFLLVGAAVAAQKPNYYTFCFWDGFSRWRPEPYKSTVRDIPAKLCNAVVYSHVTVNEKNGWIKLTDKELALDPDAKSYANSFLYNPVWLLPPSRVFAQLRELKDRNPKLKLLLAVGGPHDPVEKYWKLFPEVHLWKDLTESLAQWLRAYDFDGVVLDFFSGSQSLQDSIRSWDNALYIHPFVRQINYGLQAYRKNWSITFTLPAFDSTTHHLFDIEKLTQEVNFFLVKTSDCQEFPKGAFLNVTRTMDMTDIDRAELIVEKGAPRQRIVLDIPLSGRTYTAVAEPSGTHIVFPGHAGPYTKLQGFLAFFELCSHIKAGWKRERFGEEACSFLKQADQYVSYEDDDSIRRKARMVVGRQYRGAAVRSVDLGDYTGSCAQKSHLLKALRSTLDITDHYVHFYYDPPNTTWWEDVQRRKNSAPTEPPPSSTAEPSASATQGPARNPPSTTESKAHTPFAPFVPSATEKHSTATPGPTTQAASTTESLMSRALQQGGRFLWFLLGNYLGIKSQSSTPGQAAHLTATTAAPGPNTQAASTTESFMSRALQQGGRFLWFLLGNYLGINSQSSTPGQAAHLTATTTAPGASTQAASTTESFMSRALQQGGRFLWFLLGNYLGSNSRTSTPGQAAPPTTQASPQNTPENTVSNARAPLVPSIPSGTEKHLTATTAAPETTTRATSATESLISRALQKGGRFLWDLLGNYLGSNSGSSTPGQAAPPTTQAPPQNTPETTESNARTLFEPSIESATEEHSTATSATPGATTQAAPTTESLMSRALQKGGRFIWDLLGNYLGDNSGSSTPGQAAPPTTQAPPQNTPVTTESNARTPFVPSIPSATEEHSTPTSATPGATTQAVPATESLISRALQQGGRFLWDFLGNYLGNNSESTTPGEAAPPTTQAPPQNTPETTKSNARTPFVPSILSTTEEHSTATTSTPGATTRAAPTTESLMSRGDQDGGRFRWELLGNLNDDHSESSTPGKAVPPTTQPATATDKSSDRLFATAPVSPNTPTESPTPQAETSPVPTTAPSVPSTPELEASSALPTTAPDHPTPKITTSSAPPTKPADRPTSVVVPVTRKNEGDLCKGVESGKLLPHESDCAKYYQCVHSRPILRTCGQSTIFDIQRQTCNWPTLANRPECL
ncbi:mucin-17-like isoform X2 [Dermacentor albipictus]|uniref:mucin-17-like isoform X2 n=1 Tax=Dermacentor albipictus TaxID=60249 RepID=UPI0038FC8B42